MERKVSHPIDAVSCVLPVHVGSEAGDPSIANLDGIVPWLIFLLDGQNLLQVEARVLKFELPILS